MLGPCGIPCALRDKVMVVPKLYLGERFLLKNS